jgi:hypothetical protein
MTASAKPNKCSCSHERKPKALQEVVSEWFQVEPAESSQALLWIIMKSALESTSADYWTADQRSCAMFLYERLHNLIADLDTVHTVHKYKGLHEI